MYQLPELRQLLRRVFPLGFSGRVRIGQVFESVSACGSYVMLLFLGGAEAFGSMHQWLLDPREWPQSQPALSSRLRCTCD